jgi:hypothetical protein
MNWSRGRLGQPRLSFGRRSSCDVLPDRAVKPRVLLINLVGLCLLAAAWAAGGAGLVLNADRLHAAPAIAALTLLGVTLCWRGKWEAAEWLADKLPVIGLIGTVLGVLLAIQDAQSMDLDAAKLQLFSEIGRSLVANLLGIAGYAWLSLVIKVCRP